MSSAMLIDHRLIKRLAYDPVPGVRDGNWTHTLRGILQAEAVGLGARGWQNNWNKSNATQRWIFRDHFLDEQTASEDALQ